MKIDIRHINVGPRRDGGPKAAEPKVNIDYNHLKQTMLLEVVDLNNPEFQVTLTLTKDEIMERFKHEGHI